MDAISKRFNQKFIHCITLSKNCRDVKKTVDFKYGSFSSHLVEWERWRPKDELQINSAIIITVMANHWFMSI